MGCCTSTRRVQGAQAHFRSALNAPAPGSCDDVRSSSPARWRARPDWPTDCAPEVCAALCTTAVSCRLHAVQLVVIRFTCSGICALSFVWQPVHVSRTQRVAGCCAGGASGASGGAAEDGALHGRQVAGVAAASAIAAGAAPVAAAPAPAAACGGTGAMGMVSSASECAGEGGNDGGGWPAGGGTLGAGLMTPDWAGAVPMAAAAAAGGATAGAGAPECAAEESRARLAARSCRAAPSGSSSRWM